MLQREDCGQHVPNEHTRILKSNTTKAGALSLCLGKDCAFLGQWGGEGVRRGCKGVQCGRLGPG